MRHASDGSLRRLLDEDWAVGEPLRRHIAGCDRCQQRLAAMRDLRETTRRLLASPDAPDESGAALERQRRLQSQGRQVRVGLSRPRTAGGMRWAAGLAGAAALLALLAATPVGGYARSLLLIFEPEHFTAVQVAPGQAGSFLSLGSLGSMRQSGGGRLAAEPDLAALQAAAGFRVAVPASLPSGLPAPSYAVVGRQTQSLTLDRQRLAAYAARHQLQLPPMPGDLSGSVLSVTTGPAAVLSYGIPAARLGQAGGMPLLVVAEAPVPQVFSTGATVSEIEDYVLSLPGVSPQISAEIRAIADPARTMPIPVPMGQATSAPVTIGSAQGLWVQEADGKAGGVVWTSGGYVFGVAGTLGRQELLTVAASLR